MAETKPIAPIPPGYATLTPSLTVSDAKAALAFYTKAFDAEERSRSLMPDGRVMHAELRIGTSLLMLTDAFPDWGGPPAPAADANLPTALHVFTEDADALFRRAVDAGATATMEVADMFWGDRMGQVRDPFGHRWNIATRVAEPTEAEMIAARKKQVGA